MTIKILISENGQQIIADTKQVSKKDTEELVAYWVSNPQVIIYSRDEDGTIGVRFQPFCMVSDEAEFSIKADWVVSILEPREDVLNSYREKIYPTQNESSADTLTDGTDPDNSDGTNAGGAEGTYVPTDDSVGNEVVVTETVA